MADSGEGGTAKPAASAPLADVRARAEDFRWGGVDVLAYKQDADAPFAAITRQTLFASPELGCELRYFEVEPGGHSTLERHLHVHAVMILRGSGHCLVGRRVHAVRAHDLVHIAPMTWHQFRATRGEAIGFLCMVNASRDKPQLPSAAELAELAAEPRVAAFLAGAPTA